MPNDVLIVEDDPIIALDFEDTILGFGVKTVRTAANVARALALIAEQPPDFALLDVGLIREKSFAVAERLEALENSVRLRHRLWHRRQASGGIRDKPRLPKPCSTDALQALLKNGTSGLERLQLANYTGYTGFGSSVVDHSATSARSRNVTVIWPLAPSILT